MRVRIGQWWRDWSGNGSGRYFGNTEMQCCCFGRWRDLDGLKYHRVSNCACVSGTLKRHEIKVMILRETPCVSLRDSRGCGMNGLNLKEKD
jgi:hypothetical protein